MTLRSPGTRSPAALMARGAFCAVLGALALVAPLRAQGVPEAAPPSPELVRRLKLSPHYEQWVDVGGFPVLASRRVAPTALLEAAYLVRGMLKGRPDLLAALAAGPTRLVVMGREEWTTSVPEHSDLLPAEYWDQRARGLGATTIRPAVSVGEENLLAYPGDPYRGESILVHELSHAIHQMALESVDPGFDRKLAEVYAAAIKEGLWKGTYAARNRFEYWAEGVQSYFDTNREGDGEHGEVNTREELLQYDPRLYRLIAETLRVEQWRYVPVSRRQGEAHLSGYEPDRAPRFQWPRELLEWRRNLKAAPGKAPAPDLLGDPGNAGRSQPGGAPAAVIFVNQLLCPVRLYWLDPAGRRHDHGFLRPGEVDVKSTRSGHAWLAQPEEGPARVFVARAGSGRALIR